MNFSHVRPGDRVWLGRSNQKTRIVPVVKVTPTQIVTAWSSTYQVRYRTHSGFRVGGSFMSEHIIEVATLAECNAWDAQQEKAAKISAAKAHAAELLEEERVSLVSMFGHSCHVTPESWGIDSERAGFWSLELHFITKDQIARIADLVKALKPFPPANSESREDSVGGPR